MSAIFLDLDGTLLDPMEGITLSIQHALRELGMEDVPQQDELTWCIGPSLWSSFSVLLGEHADLDEAVGLYRERYTDEGMYEAEVYDGIGEMLMSLRETGLPLFIATSKPHSYANTIVDHFGIGGLIDGLFGSELDGTHSDKAELLAHALAETGADPHRSLMIGDRLFDIEGARANEIRSIGALWGYGGLEELRQADADALAGDPEEIPEMVIDLLGLDD